MNSSSINNQDAFDEMHLRDEKLSQRFISLDPSGYFLIKLDHSAKTLVVEHYLNDIDEMGRAIDKDTRQPIGCKESHKKAPSKVFRGRSAKEIGIQLTEGKGPFLLSRLDHALYMGRELQKAETCLVNTKQYVQD